MAKAGGSTHEGGIYYAAKLLGQVSQNLSVAALFLVAGTSSHAAIGLSSLFIAQILPSVLFGFLGGAVSDRIGPARAFVLGSGLRLWVIIAGLLLLQNPGMAWVIAFGYSLVSQISSPAEMALVRVLPKTTSSRSHSLILLIQYGGQGLGMLILAPALYYIGGAETIMTGAAGGFAVVLMLTALLALRLRNTPATLALPARSAFSFRETTRFFRGEALARDAVGVIALRSIVAQGVIVALPLYLKHDMGLGKEAAAFLLVPGGAGCIAGLLWGAGAKTRARAKSLMQLTMLGMVVSVFALAALDFGIRIVFEYSKIRPFVDLTATMNTTFAVALPVAFVLGVSLTASVVGARAVLTETAPLGQQSRVFAVQSTLTDGIIVLPLLLAGVGVQFAGARPTLAAIGFIGLLMLPTMYHPRLRPRDIPVLPQPEPELELEAV